MPIQIFQITEDEFHQTKRNDYSASFNHTAALPVSDALGALLLVIGTSRGQFTCRIPTFLHVGGRISVLSSSQPGGRRCALLPNGRQILNVMGLAMTNAFGVGLLSLSL